MRELQKSFSYEGKRTAIKNINDYVINFNNDYITVGGIRSTGFTASLGIAEFVRIQAEEKRMLQK